MLDRPEKMLDQLEKILERPEKTNDLKAQMIVKNEAQERVPTVEAKPTAEHPKITDLIRNLDVNVHKEEVMVRDTSN